MALASIILENVNLEIPLLHSMYHRSIRSVLVHSITGGKIENRHVSALKNVSLTLKPGDRCALLGHNGAGKTSLLRLLAGVYQPTHGKLHLCGQRRSLLNLNTGFYEELNGYENSDLFLRTRLLITDKKKRQAMIAEIQKISGLGEFFHVPIRAYSQGMRYRLLFAAATIRAPQILLMDEILGFSDMEFRNRVYERTIKFYQDTDIIVLATQNMEFVEQICNTVVHLVKGEISKVERNKDNSAR